MMALDRASLAIENLSALVCEDHPLTQMGVRLSIQNLAPTFGTIWQSSTGNEALTIARANPLDVAFLDLGLPDLSGIELIQKLKALHAHIRVLVITGCDSPATLRQARQEGASLLAKSSSPLHLRTATQSLVQGRTYIDPALATILDQEQTQQLTASEYKVLESIARGSSNQEISDQLGCAITTVRFHRANILAKTGMRNAAELTAWFLQGQGQRY